MVRMGWGMKQLTLAITGFGGQDLYRGAERCNALKPSADHPRETMRDPQQDCDNTYSLQHLERMLAMLFKLQELRRALERFPIRLHSRRC
jgi:hypothetical protein